MPLSAAYVSLSIIAPSKCMDWMARFSRPETRRAERHIFEGRALKRHILQCWQVKRDADKGLPIKSLSAQVGIVEVHAEKGTAFKDRFSQVGIVEFDIRQLDVR